MENMSAYTILHLLARNPSAADLPVNWQFADIEYGGWGLIGVRPVELQGQDLHRSPALFVSDPGVAKDDVPPFWREERMKRRQLRGDLRPGSSSGQENQSCAMLCPTSNGQPSTHAPASMPSQGHAGSLWFVVDVKGQISMALAE
jgi:hypothetical protein